MPVTFVNHLQISPHSIHINWWWRRRRMYSGQFMLYITNTNTTMQWNRCQFHSFCTILACYMIKELSYAISSTGTEKTTPMLSINIMYTDKMNYSGAVTRNQFCTGKDIFQCDVVRVEGYDRLSVHDSPGAKKHLLICKQILWILA